MLFAAGVVLGLIATVGQASGSAEPVPMQPLNSLITADDYPPEAIGKGEQGVAEFRLTVGPQGRVTGCAITKSSGSAALDSASCTIMVRRARFHPARDAQGQPVTGEITQRIAWVMPNVSMTPRAHAAFMLWTSCAVGEAAKLAFSDLSAAAIAARSFPPCADLEAVAAREVKSDLPMNEPRANVTRMIEKGLLQARSAFEDERAER